MSGDLLVDAIRQVCLLVEFFEVDICIVSKQEQNPGNEKLVVPIVDFQSVGCFQCISKIDKGLS